MASYIPPPEIQDILERFANTPVEAILHKPYVKLALNKLRFIPITMGITHFLLPEMPIVDLIQMGICMSEQITTGNVLDETSFYRILTARNIVFLLNKAYDFNPNVRDFFNLTIKQVLDPVKQYAFAQKTDYAKILKGLSLCETNTIHDLAGTILTHLEPITEMANRKSEVCIFCDNQNAESDIFVAFELYHLFFSLYFSNVLPESFSEEVLNEKYHTREFIDDNEKLSITIVRINPEGDDDT